MPKKTSPLLSVAEVAEALHLSVRAVHHRIAKGHIDAEKLGQGKTSAYVIHSDELERIKRSDRVA